MATANGNPVYDFVPAGDENPWIGPVAFSDADWRVLSGQLEPVNTAYTDQFCVYTGSVSGDVIGSEIEVVGTPNYNRVGAAVLNPSNGNGYATTFGYGTTLRLHIVAAWALGAQLISENDQITHVSGNRYKLEVDVSTSTDNVRVLQEGVERLLVSDATYTAGLKPAVFGIKDAGAFAGVSSWGLSVGGGAAVQAIFNLMRKLMSGN